MGTNYYLHTNHCDSCQRHDSEFIGKSSSGWKFHFRGYLPDEWDLRDGKTPITNIEYWKEKTKTGKIIDEYDREKPYDEFWDLVESKQDGKDDTQSSGYQSWLDAEGYRFSKANIDDSW